MSIIPGNYLIYTANFARRLHLQAPSAQFTTVLAGSTVLENQKIQVAAVPGQPGRYNFAVPSVAGSNDKAGNMGGTVITGGQGAYLYGQAVAKTYQVFQGAVPDHRFQIQDGEFAWTSVTVNNGVILNPTTGADNQLWVFVALPI